MKMPRVDDFLFCMKLETGGLVIGWFNAFLDVLTFILGAVLLVFASVYNCDDLRKFVEEEGKPGLTDEQNFICSFGRGIIIFVSLIMVVFSIGFFVIAFFCIRGTHRRNHFHMKPIMVLMAVITVLSFLEMFQMNARSLGSGALKCLFYGYQFIVTYSLYRKFEEEFERGLATHYQPTTEKV